LKANALRHSFQVAQYLVVPVAQHHESGEFQLSGALGIAFDRIGVLPAVALHHQHALEAGKVEDVVAERMLAPELAAFELAIAQDLPQAPLGVRWFLPQAALEAGPEDCLVGLAFHAGDLQAGSRRE
jgi:hypothetical protein